MHHIFMLTFEKYFIGECVTRQTPKVLKKLENSTLNSLLYSSRRDSVRIT